MLYKIGEFFDVYVQRLAISGVYAHEFLVLVTLTVLLLLLSGAVVRSWSAVFYLAVGIFVFYALWFRMHWHSILAYPFIVGTIGYCFARQDWQHVVAFRPSAPPRIGDAVKTKEGFGLLTHLGVFMLVGIFVYMLPKVTWVFLIAFLALAGILVWSWLGGSGSRARTHSDVALPSRFSRWRPLAITALVAVLAAYLPKGSLLVLMAMIPLALAFLIVLAFWRGGEKLLGSYIDGEPRMSSYFECVRRLEALPAPASRLAANRLDQAEHLLDEADRRLLRPRWGLWACLFALGGSRFMQATIWFLRWLRLFPKRERLRQFESKFVVDCLQNERERTWARYERLRYTESLDDYRREVQKRAPLPAELNAGETSEERAPERWENARNVRLKWLAQTEALAECCFFSGEETKGDSRPDLLRAAALLSAAGELQHEIVRDLRAYRSLESHKHGHPREKLELRLAEHYFELAAQCLECFLDPREAAAASAQDVPGRAETFCGVLRDEAWWQEAHDVADRMRDAEEKGHQRPAEAQDFHVRLALLWLYVLMAELRGRAGVSDQPVDGRQGHASQSITDWLKGGACGLIRDVLIHLETFDLPGDPESAVAHICAYASLMINSESEGTVAGIDRVLRTAGRQEGQPPNTLALFEALVEEVEGRTEQRRIMILRGRLDEQEMARHLLENDFWWGHCLEAAKAYRDAPSSRVWRLDAMASPQQAAGEETGESE